MMAGKQSSSEVERQATSCSNPLGSNPGCNFGVAFPWSIRQFKSSLVLALVWADFDTDGCISNPLS